MSNRSKNIFIWIVLMVLTGSAFFIRLENFKNTRARNIDEVVYFRMAIQMSQNLADYHTIPYGKELKARGRDLPEYFFQPLFKHPPVFSLLNTWMVHLFGPTFLASFYISLLSGVLAIPLVYVLGRLVFSELVGLLAAVFLYLDPVSIMSSQKVWMDSPIAFFTLLSVVFFAYALKTQKDHFYLLTGLATGLAMLTKYTGGLILIVYILYACAYKKNLLIQKSFLVSLMLPLFMLIPWIVWNVQVYGKDIIQPQAHQEPMVRILIHYFPFLAAGMFIVTGVIWFYRKQIVAKIRDMDQVKNSSKNQGSQENKLLEKASVIVVVFFLPLLLSEQIKHAFQLTHVPLVTWYQGTFSGEPPTFYFGKLIEYFPVYIFAFISIFIFHRQENDKAPLIRISAILIILFFIAWGNYQSRYIASSLPFLLVLAAEMIVRLFQRIYQFHSFLMRGIASAGLAILLVYIFVKVMLINQMISFTNDMCYF